MRVSKLTEQTNIKIFKLECHFSTNIFLDWKSFKRTGKVLNNFKLELRAFGIWNFSLKQNSLADFGFEFLWVLEFIREMNCIVSIWNINQIRGPSQSTLTIFTFSTLLTLTKVNIFGLPTTNLFLSNVVCERPLADKRANCNMYTLVT